MILVFVRDTFHRSELLDAVPGCGIKSGVNSSQMNCDYFDGPIDFSERRRAVITVASFNPVR